MRTSENSTASMTRSYRFSTASGGRGSWGAFLITQSRAYHPAPDKARGKGSLEKKNTKLMVHILLCVKISLNELDIRDAFRILIKYFARSILTSCIGKSDSEDDLSGAEQQNGKRPVSPGPGKNGSTWTGRRTENVKDENDGFDENYFQRRPKSFYFEGRRLCQPETGDLRLGDESHFRSMMLGHPLTTHQSISKQVGGLGPQYLDCSPALTKLDMFLSQDTLTSLHSVHTTQPNTPDLLLHRKAVSFELN